MKIYQEFVNSVSMQKIVRIRLSLRSTHYYFLNKLRTFYRNERGKKSTCSTQRALFLLYILKFPVSYAIILCQVQFVRILFII